MKAGSRLREHRSAGAVSVQTLEGRLRLEVSDQTVELPAGTSPADVEAVKAFAVPVAAAPPADWRIEVRSIARGFMLGADYAPGASFVSRQGSAVLTAASPEAVLWQAP